MGVALKGNFGVVLFVILFLITGVFNFLFSSFYFEQALFKDAFARMCSVKKVLFCNFIKTETPA